MRIEIELFSEEQAVFPKEYRRHFISFLKTVFSKAGVFKELYQGKSAKPFVFSVWLGDNFEIENEDIKIGDRIYFLFSTGDPYIFSHFYNGSIRIKEEDEAISLEKANFKIKNISLLPPKKIGESKILCKTIGISILTNPVVSAKDFKNWYLIPSDNIGLFNEVLKKRTNEKYEYTKGVKGNFEIALKPLSDNELFIFKSLQKNFKGTPFSLNETIVKHYDAYLRGFRGVFMLEGDREILQFVYDYGLGVRTGQGFGMIDILG